MNFKRIRNLRILRWQSASEAAVILMFITFLSKIIGYLRTVLVAYYFGASAQVDAFVIAMLIPAMILGIIGGGMQAVIIPVYTGKKKESIKKAKVFVNQIFLINVLVLGVFSLIMFLFPTFFIKLVAYGFNGERLTLAAFFMRLLILYGFLNIFIGFFIGLLQSERQFLFPAVTMLVANSLVPTSLFLLAPRIGINSWTVGEISFGVFGFSVMYTFLFYKKQFFRSFELYHINWQEIWHFFILLFPIIISSGVGALYQIVDKTVASSLPEGSVAALNFAQLIYRIPLGLIAVPIVVAVYPLISTLAANKEKIKYSDALKRTFSLLMFVMFPIMAVFIAYAKPIVQILYQHGAFTSSATNTTAFAVSMYSIGIFTISVNFLFQRVFFSFKDTKTPLYITLFAVVFNAVGDILLSKIWGVGGIGFATAAASIIGFFAYVYALRIKKYASLPYRFLIKEGLKVIFGSLVIFVSVVLFKSFINLSAGFIQLLLRFTAIAILLLVIYLVITSLTHSFGLRILLKHTKKFVKQIFR